MCISCMFGFVSRLHHYLVIVLMQNTVDTEIAFIYIMQFLITEIFHYSEKHVNILGLNQTMFP